MNSPWVPFPVSISGQYQVGYIAEPSTLGKTASQHPVGTGPFVFQQWVPNDHFTATKNPHYWRPGMPYLDQITYRPIPDLSVALTELKTNNVDFLFAVGPKDIADIKSTRSNVGSNKNRTLPGPESNKSILAFTLVTITVNRRSRETL